ncbi:MAG TPA: hypothetical protein VFA20_12245 [Myxococcaceae bacterium]|nr:hypothetical protein [Myxococcaceae bacterium]
MIAWIDGYAPVRGLAPIITAVTAFTKRISFVGDVAPAPLAMFVRLQSVMPRGVRLTYAGMDDAWLEKEGAIRSPKVDLYIEQYPEEIRLWRALKEAHPSIVRTIGPNSVALLDRGLAFHIEGAANPEWHGETMLKLAFRRAMGSSPPRTVRRRRTLADDESSAED